MKPFLLSLILLASFGLFAQKQKPFITASDSSIDMPTYDLKEVVVFTKKEFSSYEDRLAFERLKRNTQKVYPYVVMAKEIYEQMNEDMDSLKRRRKKKRMVKDREKELRAQFEEEIRHLTKSQGKILILLINRETGNSCYDIVKELRSPFIAFFWNMAGKFYGHDLKAEYIPEENEDLEFIVKMIKNEDLPK